MERLADSSVSERTAVETMRGRAAAAGAATATQPRVMAAAVWGSRGRTSAVVLGSASRSKSTQASPKSHYDAVVIGGGERCCGAESDCLHNLSSHSFFADVKGMALAWSFVCHFFFFLQIADVFIAVYRQILTYYACTVY